MASFLETSQLNLDYSLAIFRVLENSNALILLYVHDICLGVRFGFIGASYIPSEVKDNRPPPPPRDDRNSDEIKRLKAKVRLFFCEVFKDSEKPKMKMKYPISWDQKN